MAGDYTEYTETTGVPPTSIHSPNPDVNIGFRLGVDQFFPEQSGVAIASVPNLATTGGTPGTWEQRRITFTPADLGFDSPGRYRFFLGSQGSSRREFGFVDGLVVVTTESICEPIPGPIPEPTTTTTFVEPTTTLPITN